MKNAEFPIGASRRQFLAGAGGALLAAGAPPVLAAPGGAWKPVSAAKLPRWRGFNLAEKCRLEGEKPFLEWDFDFMAEFGFDFVRLPLDYRIWTGASGEVHEKPLAEIDQALDWAKARGIHVALCLHRVPGYCVNPPKEPLDLWADGAEGDEARRQFAAQWGMLAERYKSIPTERLTFNLVNEPPKIEGSVYHRALAPAVAAIRAKDPRRVIFADGLNYGRLPVPELIPLGIAMGGRGYEPFGLSHYKASWIPQGETYPTPTWPLGEIDRQALWREAVQPWKDIEAKGVGVVIGEWGAYRFTPHEVALAWMRDCLENWRQADLGWCLWNLRGDFGPLDTHRADVTYEDYKGHALDRKMLEVLRRG